MMPIQLSRRLREWRRKQELQNYRSGLIAHCVIAAAPGKRGRKVPKPLDFFGGAPRPKPVKDPKLALKLLTSWAEENNKAFPG